MKVEKDLLIAFIYIKKLIQYCPSTYEKKLKKKKKKKHLFTLVALGPKLSRTGSRKNETVWVRPWRAKEPIRFNKQ